MTAETGRRERTIGAVLRAAAARLRAAGVETARLDAEVLLAEVLGVERWRLLADGAEEVPPRPWRRSRPAWRGGRRGSLPPTSWGARSSGPSTSG